MSDITYPYLPGGREHGYVGMENKYMAIAMEYAKKYRSNLAQPGAAVVVKNDKVIGVGSIGNNPAHISGCERVKHNVTTGQRYDLCAGCDPSFHSEPQAIANATLTGHDTRDAVVYLWGHWWCCEPCWSAMISAGINKVYLLKNSEVLFNKQHPDNIVGKQFE
jgi:deoxycytidylate deaminase